LRVGRRHDHMHVLDAALAGVDHPTTLATGHIDRMPNVTTLGGRGLSTSGSTRSGPSRERHECQHACRKCTDLQFLCRGPWWQRHLRFARGLTAFGLYGRAVYCL
jgi:hypothetical protein